ncbi:MAG TPA: hypothetical protein VLC30_13730 [Pseudomonas sp.]|nr:hypothetical protein [Pseudomonas sp.]
MRIHLQIEAVPCPAIPSPSRHRITLLPSGCLLLMVALLIGLALTRTRASNALEQQAGSFRI